MSDAFIADLDLPTPDVHLGVGPGSQAQQVATVMARLEPVLEEHQPDCVVVVGDVSSTLAAALTADMVGVPVAHVEAGLRSRNWSMPEERNRVLTDRCSRWLFTPSPDADDNLAGEDIDRDRIHRVGNVMIDSLDWVLPRLAVGEVRSRVGVSSGPYGLVTLHRASNVDDPTLLSSLLDALVEVGRQVPLVFPVHPRTRQRLAHAGLVADPDALRLVDPLSYTDFVALMSEAALVLTDSGGIQEEAVVLGTPCLTLRHETERPITLAGGVNELVGTDPDRIVDAARRRLAAGRVPVERPHLWDGKTSERIAEVLIR